MASSDDLYAEPCRSLHCISLHRCSLQNRTAGCTSTAAHKFMRAAVQELLHKQLLMERKSAPHLTRCASHPHIPVLISRDLTHCRS
eukprot:4419168-Pleurochrysis_carterae.AAC.1